MRNANDFNQHQTTEQEAVLSGCLSIEKIPCYGVIRRIRIGRVEKKIGIGGEDHDPER